MKKVALMTWSKYHNYGTSLQATASVYAMRKLGYQVDIINYLPHAKLVTLKNYKDINLYIKKIKQETKNILNRHIIDEVKEEAFVHFLDKHVTLTRECKTDSELFLLNEKYDAFVCGSDQIWAPSIFNAKYFLDFVQNPKKMIAYAPSLGLSTIKDYYVKKQMAKNISRFSHLSVREVQGAKLIKEICNKEAKVVLDPTLLLSPDEWNPMALPVNEEEPYILCYFLGTNENNWSHVYRLSRRTNIPLKIIPIFNKDYKRGHDVIKGVGPGEFLSLVNNASLICTDSFHGTTFSIIYNKPFYTYERFSSKDSNNQNSRIYNILNLLNLEDRLVKDWKTIPNEPMKCDFYNVNKQLEIHRKESIGFLEGALHEATNTNNSSEFTITNTCCGCGACSIVCPSNAIKIKRNEEGFLKYFIDHDECILCKKCRKVCPYSYNKAPDIDKNKHNLYMLKSTNKNVLATSSSGGAGYEIARYLCAEGYDVVGCTYDKENRQAIHGLVQAGDIGSLDAFRGSKYLQSSTNVFKVIYGGTQKAVIFGTPCQIAGLHFLLKYKNKRTDYVLIDLICHGVPSQHLWNKYIDEGSRLYGYGLNPDVQFRDKARAWRDKFIRIEGKNVCYIKNENKDLFYRFFLLRHSNMHSCFECRFRTTSSADIRIGNYWGPRYKRDKEGVSMVIAMSETGESVLERLNSVKKIVLEKNQCTEYWAVQYPQNPVKPVFYDELIRELRDNDKSLDEIAEFYCRGFEVYGKFYKTFARFKGLFS